MCHISKLTVSGFGKLMQLLRGEVNLFRGLALYASHYFWHIGSAVISADVGKS